VRHVINESNDAIHMWHAQIRDACIMWIALKTRVTDIYKHQYKYNNQIAKEPHGVDCSFKIITTATNLYEKLYKNVALENVNDVKGQSTMPKMSLFYVASY